MAFGKPKRAGGYRGGKQRTAAVPTHCKPDSTRELSAWEESIEGKLIQFLAIVLRLFQQSARESELNPEMILAFLKVPKERPLSAISKRIVAMRIRSQQLNSRH